MHLKYFEKLDKVMAEAGTRDPKKLMDHLGAKFIDPGEFLPGFLMKRKTKYYYGVNRNLPEKQQEYGSAHECGHLVCQHTDIPGFLEDGLHADSSFDRKAVADTEKEANIIAADIIIETDSCLEMMGYDRSDVAAYRQSLRSFNKAVRDYQSHMDIVLTNGSPKARVDRMEAYKQELERMRLELEEQAMDIQMSGCCLTKYEISAEFGVPEFIFDYKLEALSIRNYDVESVELPSFDKVFAKWQ